MSGRAKILAVVSWLVIAVSSIATAADVLELMSGAKVQGEILSRDEKGITMNVTIGNITLKKTYPLKSVHAISRGEKRIVITEKGASSGASQGGGASSASGSGATNSAKGGSRAELDALIDRVGRTPPDWYEETQLNYPDTLDLSWPEPAPGGWNNQKNMGQFIWDIINPNPGRWREGVRLMHHLLQVHKDDPQRVRRIMLQLGRMYHDLHEDYARSAFWYRQVGVEKNPKDFLHEAVILAECYWRLGYRAEAVKLLKQARPSFPMAKLLADMGQTDEALKITKSGESVQPEMAYLTAGDACRLAGRFREALQYYQKVLAVQSPDRADRLKRFHERAQANIDAIKYFELFDLSKVEGGTYKASSQGYEGPVEVTVVVSGSKIESVKVTNHKEKQFYSAISDTPQKIIAKQNVKGVDATSNATITSEAIINATARALGERNP